MSIGRPDEEGAPNCTRGTLVGLLSMSELLMLEMKWRIRRPVDRPIEPEYIPDGDQKAMMALKWVKFWHYSQGPL